MSKYGDKRRRKLKGATRLAQAIEGMRFKDGLEHEAQRIAVSRTQRAKDS